MSGADLDPAPAAPPAIPATAPASPADAPPPAPPPCWPGWRLLGLAVAIIWGIDLAIGVAYAIVAIAAHGPQLGGDIGPAGVVITGFLSTAGTFAVIRWIICKRCRRGFAAGFAWRPVGRRTAVSCVALGLLAAGAAAAIISEWGTGESFMSRLIAQPGGLLAIAIMALALPPFEELYYRGFLFPTLRRLVGPWPAIALTFLWFAGVHAWQLSGDPASLALVSTMGLVWTLQRHWSGSLVPSVLTHWTYNAGVMLLTLVLPGPG